MNSRLPNVAEFLVPLLRRFALVGCVTLAACDRPASEAPQQSAVPVAETAEAAKPKVEAAKSDKGQPEETLPTLFEDVTAGSGLEFTYRNGEEADHYSILESLGGGVALFDYDRDGLLDVYLPGGGFFNGPEYKQIRGRPNRLFKNLGDWRFRDATAEAGLPDEGSFYSHGAAACDYDNDGWTDLLLTGYGGMALYRNDRGQFRDVTADSGFENPNALHWSTSASWGDINGDGWPDLFVPHYLEWTFERHPPCQWSNGKLDLCPPHKFEPLLPALYLSQKGRSFVRQTETAFKPARGLGSLMADFDDDGRLDIYVANDGMDNHLYVNRGDTGLEEVGTQAGVAYDDNGKSTGSMGIDAADCDGSGRLSIVVANFESEEHALYRNAGNASFRYASRTSGIAALGKHLVAFGVGFTDFDRDGQQDLVFANGHVLRHPASGLRRQEAVLLHNTRRAADPPGRVRFSNVTASGGSYFQKPHLGRGLALGDLDNDGRTDLVISHMNEPAAVLKNIAQTSSQWLGVSLQGQAPQGQAVRDAIGARLELTQGALKQVRVIKGGGSYLSTNDLRLIFSLHEGAFQLTIRWPSGREQTFDEQTLRRDQYNLLVEGEAPEADNSRSTQE